MPIEEPHNMDRFILSAKVAEAFEFEKWTQQIPYLKVRPGYLIKPVPAFAGAVVRFCIQKEGSKHRVSVYLDCYDLLGSVGEPYWEAYPIDGDTGRYTMNDTDELMDAVYKELDKIIVKHHP